MSATRWAKLPRPSHIAPVISVIVPTRNEAGNIAAHLCGVLIRSASARRSRSSSSTTAPDNTPELIQALQTDGHEHILIHRSEDERGNGLGGAVVRGCRQRRRRACCVIDDDLQHPPELIPMLLRKATTKASMWSSPAGTAKDGGAHPATSR